MRTARLVAQCKVNLFLGVLAREASGYHQLETLFARLALGDHVSVRLGGTRRSLDIAGPAMPVGGLGPMERNLAWRAAMAYGEAAGVSDGFVIEIEKRIPVGGGLGGGSADAGAVLRAMNALCPRPLPQDELLRIAATLGADVPFLTQERSSLALAWGRGDRLLSLPELDSRPCTLVCFPFGVPTADAYRWLSESPASPIGPIAYMLSDLTSWTAIARLARNEFERVVLPRFSPIAEVLAAARGGDSCGGSIALMSGSGSTVFCIPATGETSAAASAEVSVALRESADRAGARLVETSVARAVEQVEVLD